MRFMNFFFQFNFNVVSHLGSFIDSITIFYVYFILITFFFNLKEVTKHIVLTHQSTNLLKKYPMK